MTLKKLGRYELLRVLGKGAMGVVYEGRDPNLDRRVAIKTVKVENLSEEAAAEYEHRFRTEARSAARLQHPNIVSVYDSDRDGDIAFLVMEYIQGDDLKHHLDRGTRYSLEQSLKIIREPKHRLVAERTSAQPMLVRLKRKAVAQRRISVAEAAGQRPRQRIHQQQDFPVRIAHARLHSIFGTRRARSMRCRASTR